MRDVICVDGDGWFLTTGETYGVLYEANGWITVFNDRGRASEYPSEVFEYA